MLGRHQGLEDFLLDKAKASVVSNDSDGHLPVSFTILCLQPAAECAISQSHSGSSSESSRATLASYQATRYAMKFVQGLIACLQELIQSKPVTGSAAPCDYPGMGLPRFSGPIWLFFCV